MLGKLLQLDGGAQDFINGNWLEALLGTFTSVWGTAGFALFVGGVLGMGILTWSQSIALTATWLALTAGVVLTAAPPTAAYIGYILLAIAVALGLYNIVK